MRISDWSSDVCSSDLKDWRTDRYLSRLEAMMAVADAETSLVLTGNGDVLEPENGLLGIGSGGSFALAAARALVDVDTLHSQPIARQAPNSADAISARKSVGEGQSVSETLQCEGPR